MQVGTEQVRQQLVADQHVGLVAGQHQVGLDAQPGTGRGRHPAVVRLPCADGDQAVRTVGLRLTTEELEFAGLVPAHAEAGQVVALEPQLCTARKPRPTFQRRGQGGQ